MIKKPLFTLPAVLLPMTALFFSATASANLPPVVEITTLVTATTPTTVIAPPITTPIAANDDARRQALLGTWQALDSPTATQINGEGTFTADGKATGYTTATYVYNDGYTSDVKVALSFEWRLENGIITLDHFKSDPAMFIKSTHIKKFEIKSMTSDSLVLKDLSDGEEVYRRRKPG